MSHDNTSSGSEIVDHNTLLDEGNRYYQKKNMKKRLAILRKLSRLIQIMCKHILGKETVSVGPR